MEEFPAHAGMNRFFLKACPLPSGVPRTRGDEPIHQILDFKRGKSSPHTRG